MNALGIRVKKETITDAALTIEERIVKANGDVVIKKYTKGRLLGKGGFAKCYEVIDSETKKTLAAKIVSKVSLTKSRAKQKLMSEIKIHRNLNHKHIVFFEQYFEDSENFYIILELCVNQTLSELIKRRRRLTELEVKCYIVQILEGLKYLHSHRVIHRDLKLGNLFLTEKMLLKIGDFGLAAKLEFEGERKRTICGTPNYIAPEILEGRHGHSYEVDIWSLGVILYTLLVGKPPFETQDVKATYKRIKMNLYTFPETVEISDEAKNLVHKILSSDPSKRPKAEEILAHPFFTNTKIPEALPTSTLVCPPSSSYIKQYKEDAQVPSDLLQMRLEHTASYKENQEHRRIERPNTHRGIVGRKSSANLVSTRFSKVSARREVLAENIDNENRQNVGKRVQEEFVLTAPSKVWIKKWVDYSSKYGLGYVLSTGASGVFFNDSTKIILEPDGQHFDYIEKKGPERTDITNRYSLQDYPKALQKKVTLLQYFKNYLASDNKIENGNTGRNEENIYVKKWLKTKHAVMFRLSNKVVQVTFQDETEIILSSESKVITYVNKKGERLNYHLNTALESNNTEMIKRLKYTREILTRMLKQNQHNQGPRIDLHSERAIHNNAVAQI